jgi:hypothetical protein
VQGGPAGGIGAGGDDGTDLRHAQLGGLLDDGLHAVALQRRQGQHHAERGLRAARRGGAAEPDLDTLAGHAVERGLELRAFSIEDADRRAGAEAEDLPRVMRRVLRQSDP